MLGTFQGATGTVLEISKNIRTVSAAMYDAVVIASGPASVAKLAGNPEIIRFVGDALRYGKTVGALGAGLEVLFAP